MRVWQKVGDVTSDRYSEQLNIESAAGREFVPPSEMAEKLGITPEEALRAWNVLCAGQSSQTKLGTIQRAEAVIKPRKRGRKRKNYALDVAKAERLLAAGKSLRQVAAECGTSHTTIRRIALGSRCVPLSTWLVGVVKRMDKLAPETVRQLEFAREIDARLRDSKG